ncbi:hypothetical protein C5167_029782 [Papaver somniferum]|uniref:probable polyamine transporter At3g13620 n=1 Tax=Papaver somniferum TaxID=3469 RepID=UPI000E6F5ED0|nr:probable polyamine transporter At3g13620 [Papaver somniferum]RZC87871.1 hypothetical protein C5167_029782 [Papaver somniferum]
MVKSKEEIELCEVKVESPISVPKPFVKKKLTLVPLIFLIFFEVSGGPFGEENSVKAAGPLFALLGFTIFPFIWSTPEALITAELATAYPGNGGYVIWASEAFGPFWGSMMGSLKFLSGSINNAAYPSMMTQYLSVPTRFNTLVICGITVLLSFVNYLGLAIVGWFAVALAVVALMPFVIMFCIAIPKIKWRRILSLGKNVHKIRMNDWPTFFNSLFWNLNFWDNASTLAGEVENPQKIFPKALFSAGIITCLGYLIPLIAIIGALPLDQDAWEVGYLATAGGTIGGPWLKYWIKIGSVLSSVGLFEAQLSSSSFQTEGMANLGFIPALFAKRAKWFNTPWAGILLSSLISFGLSFLDFNNIIAAANILYGLGMLLEFSAFIRLRYKYPDLARPYKVPGGIPCLCIMCLIPAGFVAYVMTTMVITKLVVFYITAGLTVFAVGNYFVMNLCKSKGYIQFITKDNDKQAVEKESTEGQS